MKGGEGDEIRCDAMRCDAICAHAKGKRIDELAHSLLGELRGANGNAVRGNVCLWHQTCREDEDREKKCPPPALT